MLGSLMIEHGTLEFLKSEHGSIKFLTCEHGTLEFLKSEHGTLKLSILTHEMFGNCTINHGMFETGTFNPGTADGISSRYFPKSSKSNIILLDFLKARQFGSSIKCGALRSSKISKSNIILLHFLKARQFGSSIKCGALRSCTFGPGSPATILNCPLGSTGSFTFEHGTRSMYIPSPLRSGPVHVSLMSSSSLVELHIL